MTIGGTSSTYLNITCGVPQGSIMGQRLLLIYTNDMHNAVRHSIVHHFAEDTNLLCAGRNPSLLRKKMNEDLKLIFEWLCTNRLSLNVSKSVFIIFKPPRKLLDQQITLHVKCKRQNVLKNTRNLCQKSKFQKQIRTLDTLLTLFYTGYFVHFYSRGGYQYPPP